jgi:hypothetical protein
MIFLTAIADYNLSKEIERCLSIRTYVGGVLDMFLWFFFGFIFISFRKAILFSLLKHS